MKTALLMVDLQNDFMPSGALPVPQSDSIIALVNKLQPYFSCVLATQDWHPGNHGSFAAQHPGHKPGDIIDLYGISQILWPAHCVQNTLGAEFVAALETQQIAEIFHKGIDIEIDSYSGFFDNGHRRDTGLNNYLREHAIEALYIVGVATDYCVKFTALDACKMGFKTYVITDACRGVNIQPDDSQRALEEMQEVGVGLIESSSVIQRSVATKNLLL